MTQTRFLAVLAIALVLALALPSAGAMEAAAVAPPEPVAAKVSDVGANAGDQEDPEVAGLTASDLRRPSEPEPRGMPSLEVSGPDPESGNPQGENEVEVEDTDTFTDAIAEPAPPLVRGRLSPQTSPDRLLPRRARSDLEQHMLKQVDWTESRRKVAAEERAKAKYYDGIDTSDQFARPGFVSIVDMNKESHRDAGDTLADSARARPPSRATDDCPTDDSELIKFCSTAAWGGGVAGGGSRFVFSKNRELGIERSTSMPGRSKFIATSCSKPRLKKCCYYDRTANTCVPKWNVLKSMQPWHPIHQRVAAFQTLVDESCAKIEDSYPEFTGEEEYMTDICLPADTAPASEKKVLFDRMNKLIESKLDWTAVPSLFTSTYYAAKGEPTFGGQYGMERSDMDMGFHLAPDPDRADLQDVIVGKMLENGCRCAKPYVLFLVGAMGVGKNYVVDQLRDHGLWDMRANTIDIDMDAIREFLPEYQILKKSCFKSQAGTLTQREAGFIQELIISRALESGYCAIMNQSFQDLVWWRMELPRLINTNPRHKFGIIQIRAKEEDKEEIFQQACRRGYTDGRQLPRDVFNKAWQGSKETTERLTDSFLFRIDIYNKRGYFPTVEGYYGYSGGRSAPPVYEFARTTTCENQHRKDMCMAAVDDGQTDRANPCRWCFPDQPALARGRNGHCTASADVGGSACVAPNPPMPEVADFPVELEPVGGGNEAALVAVEQRKWALMKKNFAAVHGTVASNTVRCPGGEDPIMEAPPTCQCASKAELIATGYLSK